MIVCLKPIRLSVLLCCVAPVLFAGCFGNPPSPPRELEPEPSGTLLRGEFRIGIAPDYPPLAFKFRGQLVGMEVETP